jgi:hypothetical protein
MKELVLLLIFGLAVSAKAQAQPSPTPNSVDEPALPDSRLEIPHPPSSGLLPESGALPNPTPTPEIYSPVKKEPEVSSSVKPPLRPKVITKAQSKTQKRFEEIRSIAMRNSHVVNLLKRANKASTSSVRRSLMRTYYLAVCARMRALEPSLKTTINAYQEEKAGTLARASQSKAKSSKRSASGKKQSASETHSSRRRHAYSHRVVYPDDYGPYEPYRYGPYGPYGPFSGY